MESIERGSTLANLISRFREAPPVTKTMRTKGSEFWWNTQQSPQRATLINTFDETESELIANYAALPDSYLEIPTGQFDSESPVPVSRIAINTKEANRQIQPTTKHSKVTKFNPSTDILQEWRLKRKREALDYRMHASPDKQQSHTTSPLASPIASASIKKQNYYKELTNKYLPQPRGALEHSICNPVTHSPSTSSPVYSGIMRDSCTDAETSVQTMDTISRGLRQLETCVLNNADTIDVCCELVESIPIENFSESAFVRINEPAKVDAETSTTDLRQRKQIDVLRQTKYLMQTENPPVKLMSSQSVQTSYTKEVEIQTAPSPSPPTRDLLPVPPAIPSTGQELEESIWSISSLTSEGISDHTENTAGGDKETSADRVVESNGEIDYLTLFEEDELIQLLVGKARFYEQHIENINTLLNTDN